MVLGNHKWKKKSLKIYLSLTFFLFRRIGSVFLFAHYSSTATSPTPAVHSFFTLLSDKTLVLHTLKSLNDLPNLTILGFFRSLWEGQNVIIRLYLGHKLSRAKVKSGQQQNMRGIFKALVQSLPQVKLHCSVMRCDVCI